MSQLELPTIYTTAPILDPPNLSQRKNQRILTLSTRKAQNTLASKADRIANYLRDLADTFQDIKDQLSDNPQNDKENSSSALNKPNLSGKSPGKDVKDVKEGLRLDQLNGNELRAQLEEVLDTFTEAQRVLGQNPGPRLASITFADNGPVMKSPGNEEEMDCSLKHLESQSISNSIKGYGGSFRRDIDTLSVPGDQAWASRSEETLSWLPERTALSRIHENRGDAVHESRENIFNDISPIWKGRSALGFSGALSAINEGEAPQQGDEDSANKDRSLRNGNCLPDYILMDVSPLLPREEVRSWLNNANDNIRKDISTDYSIELEEGDLEDKKKDLEETGSGCNGMILEGLDKDDFMDN